MSDVSSPPAPSRTVDELQRENAKLRAELARHVESDRKAAERRKRIIKTGGSLLIPLLDRQKVVRSFLTLFETGARFSGPREEWPTRDELLADAKLFSLACVRFAIRRRVIMFLISLGAFIIPGIQIWLFIQQNRIIENQNEYIQVQIYDVVARSMTSGDMSGKLITSALLGSTDPEFLDGIAREVFEADMGGAFTEADLTAAPRRLRDAAFRGHLLLALTRSLEQQGKRVPLDELYTRSAPMFRRVVSDATLRVPELLRFGRDAALSDGELAEEVYRYLFNLGSMLRQEWSLALTMGQEADYFQTIAPLLARVASARGGGLGERSPFQKVFFEDTLHELLVDMALETRWGEPQPSGAALGPIEQLLARGFARMKSGVGATGNVNWTGLARQAGLP
jgi:hypothetical protein